MKGVVGMNRLNELIENLEYPDISKLQRWDGLGYEEFCNAVDDYCCEKDYENWRNLLKAVANMIKLSQGKRSIDW